MTEATNPLVESFTTSYPIDCRLYRYDIEGSIAHCRMLGTQKIIPARDAKAIVAGLKAILLEFETGRFVSRAEDEDIHMAVERRLIELVGPVGGKLHTARSRNDQVALDLRLYVRAATDRLSSELSRLNEVLMVLAEQHIATIMPGYTHLQQAQPVLLSHHLLAYAQMFVRDRDRLLDCRRRTNVMPLGAGALAGTTFPIDREQVARALNFPAVTQNSLDSVSDRDFALDLLSAGAILGMHLSRLAEEIVLWSSQEFGFIELPDDFATGSSMMPQKKNPDVAELIRGKSGRLVGNLLNLLMILKGLPLSYNRDLQEDKGPVFDTVDTLSASLNLLALMLPRIKFHHDRMREAATLGHTLATELADYLASKGVPFRQAHAIVGAVVRYAIQRERTLESLTSEELRGFSELFAEDVHSWLRLESAVSRRLATGGTARQNVARQIKAIRKLG